MDPDATLRQLRAAMTECRTALHDDGDRLPDATRGLVELVDALDEWLSYGGFLPQEWGTPHR